MSSWTEQSEGKRDTASLGAEGDWKIRVAGRNKWYIFDRVGYQTISCAQARGPDRIRTETHGSTSLDKMPSRRSS